jgi:hypothetical protein
MIVLFLWKKFIFFQNKKEIFNFKKYIYNKGIFLLLIYSGTNEEGGQRNEK